MSTEYTHFTNLAFDTLFARGPYGSETQIFTGGGVFTPTSILLPDGSAAAPSFAWVNSTNTGFFKASGSTIAAAIGGLQIFTINSGGIIASGITTSTTFSTSASNPADVGVLRLANNEIIAFRNVTNNGNITIKGDSSNNILINTNLNFQGNGIINTGTLTLPTSTDTLVGRATTDTLTNKTLTTPVISSISNTGTLTLPTSSDTLVGRATTDTLTNKTMSGSSNTFTNIPNSATTAASANTASAIVARDGSGNFVTSGIQLTTSGGTPTTLNYYEEGTISANFNQGAGASGSGTSVTIGFVRVGKKVTLTLPSNNSMTMGATSANLSTASSTVPARLAPANSYIFPAPVKVNNVTQANFGALTVGTDGSLTLNVTITGSTNWTSATSNNGFFSFTASYTI
jgi:hypothetical protein